MTSQEKHAEEQAGGDGPQEVQHGPEEGDKLDPLMVLLTWAGPAVY